MSLGNQNAGDRAEELQQLLEITSELGTLGDLDEFFQKFVVRAAHFLGFRRAFIAVGGHGRFDIRWISENGIAKPLRWELPEAFGNRLLSSPEPLFTEDFTQFVETDAATAAKLHIKQFLSVPLFGSDHSPLGVLAVLDRQNDAPVSQEDIRRAK